VDCPTCHVETSPDAAFCPACGAQLVLRCAQCGTANAPEHNFCKQCGDSLRGAPGPSTGIELKADFAERRQLTVMFCDLVGSTTLSERLDPEELRDLVRHYQQVCSQVISEHEGHIAQYLGDGLLVYFGFPRAHEDDARRAVRAGLGILEAVDKLSTILGQERNIRLAVRVGIHTGPVVVGRMGGASRHEELAIGETPNVAARLQALAEPDTVVIGATTHRLVRHVFACESLGTRSLRGASHPIDLYRALGEAPAESLGGEGSAVGLTPLVGREQEVALLLERWELVKDGIGQVAVLTGEAGIGKSRLVQVMKGRLADEPHTVLESRCSAYTQSSALYPVTELLERLLQFRREDSPRERRARLDRALTQYRLPMPETVPALVSLLSLPDDERYPPIALPPAGRKQKTFEAALRLFLAAAGERPLLLIVEDLHWIDPSTLELLGLLVEHAPAARLFALLTCRPEFRAPWPPRSQMTQITLNRFTPKHTEVMVDRVTIGKKLPAEVLDQIVAKTDGVPLFVEELTKTVLESGLLRDAGDRYELAGPLPPLAIPTTLQDSLMARLDRLGSAKAVAQAGAVLGRQFSYELLHAVSPFDEVALGQGLERLLEAELLHRRGTTLPVTYVFKHGLVQDVAYQSLLRSTRQRYHRRTAEVLVERFPEIIEAQPELVAHHFTEGSLTEPAIAYWRRAGQRAIERSASVEAIGHLGMALDLLKTQPDDVARQRQELELQTTLGSALMAARGYAAPEVEAAYRRARYLCEQLGEASQLFSVLRGLWGFHVVRADLQMAHELGEQCLALARRAPAPAALIWAHYQLGMTLFHLGELVPARDHFRQSLAVYDSEKRRAPRALQDPGVACLSYTAMVLALLGCPDQARHTSREAIALAEKLSHPFSLAYALTIAATTAQVCQEVEETRELAVAANAVAKEHAIPYFWAWGPILSGWALAADEQGDEAIAQQRRGEAAYRATGAELARPYFLALLADAYRRRAQADEGLAALGEALAAVEKTGERWIEAELHRLKGELLLIASPPGSPEAEFHVRQALAVAHSRGEQSLELRAAMSLGRLWRAEGRRDEARRLVAEIYGRFTEGFDTPDLREAKGLLDQWS
jgi:predicted ATPase/class 3 adenylate cyclase